MLPCPSDTDGGYGLDLGEFLVDGLWEQAAMIREEWLRTCHVQVFLEIKVLLFKVKTLHKMGFPTS